MKYLILFLAGCGMSNVKPLSIDEQRCQEFCQLEYGDKVIINKSRWIGISKHCRCIFKDRPEEKANE